VSRIILIHGWNVRDRGAGTVGPLVKPLESLGYEVILADYGHVLMPWSTSLASRKTAKYLSTKVEPGDIVVGHSNGARVAYDLSFYAPLIRKMIWLNPALDVDVVPAKSVHGCLVVHSNRDLATRFARWLPGTIWGAMGRNGYCPRENDPWGYDERMVNLAHNGRHSDYHIKPSMWSTIIDHFARNSEAPSFVV